VTSVFFNSAVDNQNATIHQLHFAISYQEMSYLPQKPISYLYQDFWQLLRNSFFSFLDEGQIEARLRNIGKLHFS